MGEPAYMSVLNEEQRKAVLHEGAPLLILAGAGSGKTRVITTKIAYLIGEKGLDPRSILAVTFTNKAAGEMTERVRAMVPGSSGMLIRTFHSFGAWFLRRNGRVVDLNSSFSIYDDQDALSLLHSLFPSFPKRESKRLNHWISRAKDYGLRPTDDLSFLGPHPDLPRVYAAYQERLESMGNVDFGDLILRSVEVLREHPEIKERMRQRFSVILVDEYQDSNVAQFQLLRELADDSTYLCVVGDDDQSIYRFRGAEVKNIIDFPGLFPGTEIIRLEENYRSTGNILSIASKLVANNQDRLGKTLWTRKIEGRKAVLARLWDHAEEAQYCAHLLEDGNLDGTAILYRTNAQSLAFESLFTKMGIPYRIVGSLRFYEREEVKDVLAFLAFIVNPRDEVAFRRIVNKPARGIGAATMKGIIDFAITRTQGDLYRGALEYKNSGKRISSRAKGGVEEFAMAVEAVKQSLKGKVVEGGAAGDSGDDTSNGTGLSAALTILINRSRLLEYHRDQDQYAGSQKVNNMEELINAAVDYPASLEGLVNFLEDLELDRSQISGKDQVSHGVTLITMHNTKGLEFDRVIITGLEEGLFPGYREDTDMEEERRILYVSITRAKEELYFTYCRSRRIWGRTMFQEPSRFLEEVPIEFVEEDYAGIGIGDTGRRIGSTSSGIGGSGDETGGGRGEFPPGTWVYHDDHGSGVVVKQWFKGGEEAVAVQFETGAALKFIPKYSALERTNGYE